MSKEGEASVFFAHVIGKAACARCNCPCCLEAASMRLKIRAGIERGQWFAAIHPDEGVEVAGNKIIGTREDAEFYARRMINRWLEPKSRQRINRKR